MAIMMPQACDSSNSKKFRKSRYCHAIFCCKNSTSKLQLYCHVDDFVWGSIPGLENNINKLKKTSVSSQKSETFKYLGLFIEQKWCYFSSSNTIHQLIEGVCLEKVHRELQCTYQTYIETQQFCGLARQ